jgi:hypothetical protein
MHYYVTLYLPCLIGLMAIIFLILGLRGLVTRKPFLISARWLFALMVLGFAPSLVSPFVFPMPHPAGVRLAGLTFLEWINPLMFVAILAFSWIMLQGYVAFAVTGGSFREGLLASIAKLDLPYEETLSAIRLPSLGADLQVAVQTWVGTGQVKVKPRRFRPVLQDIVRGMNEYYQASTVPVNLAGCGFYVVIGVFLLAFAVVFAVGMPSLLPAPRV